MQDDGCLFESVIHFRDKIVNGDSNSEKDRGVESRLGGEAPGRNVNLRASLVPLAHQARTDDPVEPGEGVIEPGAAEDRERVALDRRVAVTAVQPVEHLETALTSATLGKPVTPW
jgi:hypothetical protein